MLESVRAGDDRPRLVQTAAPPKKVAGGQTKSLERVVNPVCRVEVDALGNVGEPVRLEITPNCRFIVALIDGQVAKAAIPR